MIYILINAVAIALAALAGLGAGTIFYMIFDDARSKFRKMGMARIVTFAIVAYFAQMWLACILAGALILAPAEADADVMALGSAVVIWIGFVVPVIFVTHFYRKLPGGVAVRDCVYWLLVMFVQAAVLSSMGLEAPPA